MPEMLDTPCPHCGHNQKVNSKFIGKTWRCPSCGEEYNVLAPPAREPANDGPFQTFTPDEFAQLRNPTSILEDGEPAARNLGSEEAPVHPDIVGSFLDLDWNRLAERDFFGAFPRFCEKIAELQPLLSARLQRSL